MKTIIAQDSPRLIVIDEKIKHRGLFSYILPKVIAWFCFLGLTTYGFFSAILHPKVVRFFERLDTIDQRYVIVFVCVSGAAFVIWWFIKKIKG